MVNNINSYKSGPDQDGRFGIFGGRFVAETLMPLILDLEKAYDKAKSDLSFNAELSYLNKYYTGRRPGGINIPNSLLYGIS